MKSERERERRAKKTESADKKIIIKPTHKTYTTKKE